MVVRWNLCMVNIGQNLVALLEAVVQVILTCFCIKETKNTVDLKENDT